MINPWAILNVHRASTTEECRQAYYAAARANHPDVGGDPERFKLISQAWTILTLPPKSFAEFTAGITVRYPECKQCSGLGYRSRSIGFTAAEKTQCAICGGAGRVIINGGGKGA